MLGGRLVRVAVLVHVVLVIERTTECRSWILGPVLPIPVKALIPVGGVILGGLLTLAAGIVVVLLVIWEVIFLSCPLGGPITVPADGDLLRLQMPAATGESLGSSPCCRPAGARLSKGRLPSKGDSRAARHRSSPAHPAQQPHGYSSGPPPLPCQPKTCRRGEELGDAFRKSGKSSKSSCSSPATSPG